jgi:hypothetical protein
VRFELDALTIAAELEIGRVEVESSESDDPGAHAHGRIPRVCVQLTRWPATMNSLIQE